MDGLGLKNKVPMKMSRDADSDNVLAIVIVLGFAFIIVCCCCCIYHSCLNSGHRDGHGHGSGGNIELNRFFNVIEELKKLQKQFKDLLLKQEIEAKRQYEEIQNQTKQLNLLQNLVLDLKNSQSSKKKAEKDETESIGKCIICLDRSLTYAVRPCGHLIACTDCAEKLPKTCPICRRTISDTLRIFFP